MWYLPYTLSRKPPPKPAGKHVLNGRRFAKGVLWRVDQDYGHKLSPRELEWLRSFNDAHYNADFRGEVGQEYTREERRQADQAKNAARRDVSSIRDPVDLEELPPVDAQGFDVEPVPEYLSSPEYKEALREVRSHLRTKSTHDWANPSRKLDQALAALERTKKGSK